MTERQKMIFLSGVANSFGIRIYVIDKEPNQARASLPMYIGIENP